MYIYTYIYINLHIFIYVYRCRWQRGCVGQGWRARYWRRIHIYIVHINIYTCMYIYIHIYTYIYIHIHIYTYIYICVSLQVAARLRGAGLTCKILKEDSYIYCTYKHIYMHVYIYTYIYIYMYHCRWQRGCVGQGWRVRYWRRIHIYIVHINIYTCMYIYIHIYTYIYICITAGSSAVAWGGADV